MPPGAEGPAAPSVAAASASRRAGAARGAFTIGQDVLLGCLFLWVGAKAHDAVGQIFALVGLDRPSLRAASAASERRERQRQLKKRSPGHPSTPVRLERGWGRRRRGF